MRKRGEAGAGWLQLASMYHWYDVQVLCTGCEGWDETSGKSEATDPGKTLRRSKAAVSGSRAIWANPAPWPKLSTQVPKSKSILKLKVSSLQSCWWKNVFLTVFGPTLSYKVLSVESGSFKHPPSGYMLIWYSVCDPSSSVEHLSSKNVSNTTAKPLLEVL